MLIWLVCVMTHDVVVSTKIAYVSVFIWFVGIMGVTESLY